MKTTKERTAMTYKDHLREHEEQAKEYLIETKGFYTGIYQQKK